MHQSAVEDCLVSGVGWAATMMCLLLRCARTACDVRYAASAPSVKPGKTAAERPSWLNPEKSGSPFFLVTTVSSVPDQPRFANCSDNAGESSSVPIGRQKSMQRATASAGGHDTSNTVSSRRPNMPVRRAFGGVIGMGLLRIGNGRGWHRKPRRLRGAWPRGWRVPGRGRRAGSQD